jgi:hypothetical protein
VKRFAAYGCPVGGVAVMVMNQNLITKTFAIALDNSIPPPSDFTVNFPNATSFILLKL